MKRNFLTAIPLVASIAIASFFFEFDSETKKTTTPVDINNVEMTSKIDKINERLAQFKTGIAQTESYHNQFMTSVLKGYNWMMAQKNDDRYFFLFTVAESLTIKDLNERHESLKILLDEEMSRFKEGDFSYSEDKTWTGFVREMKKASAKMMEYEVQNQNSGKTQQTWMNELMTEVQDLRTLSKSQFTKQVVTTGKESKSYPEIFIVLIGLIGSLATFTSRKGTNQQSPASVNTVEDKFNLFEVASNPSPGVNIEDICNANFNNLDHIIKASEIQVTSRRKVPSIDRLMIEKNLISDAVNSLMKGTIVLAQNQKQDTGILLEWNYEIDSQRALIELQLNGREYSMEDLERNHYLLQDGSIASQFANAQSKLVNYRPVIQVLPKDGNTKIVLSLDTNPSGDMAVH